MADYFSQLKDFLQSGADKRAFHNPADESQTIDVTLLAIPDRPEGWPQGLLEPVVLDVGGNEAIAHFRDENNQVQMLFHDPDNKGEFVLLNKEQVYEMYQPTYNQLQQEIDGPSTLKEQVFNYGQTLNFQGKPSFGSDVSLEDIKSSGLVNDYEPPVVQVAPAEPEPVVSARGRPAPEAQPEEKQPEPQTLTAQAWFDQQIGGDHEVKAIADYSYPDQFEQNARDVFSRIDRQFARDPDLSDEATRTAIEDEFNNSYHAAPHIKALVADYVQDKLNGENPDRETYVTAAVELTHGRVDAVKTFLDSGELEKVADAQELNAVEPALGPDTDKGVVGLNNWETNNADARGEELRQEAQEMHDRNTVFTAENQLYSGLLGAALSSESVQAEMVGDALTSSAQVLAPEINFADVKECLSMDGGKPQVDIDALMELSDKLEPLKERLEAFNELARDGLSADDVQKLEAPTFN